MITEKSIHSSRDWKVHYGKYKIRIMSEGNEVCRIDGKDLYSEVTEEGANNAERIIACVNACKSFTNEALNDDILDRMYDSITEMLEHIGDLNL